MPAEEDRLYRLLVEGVADYAIFLLDPEGKITSWNPGAARIKGYEAGEVLGQHLSLFYTPEDVREGRPQCAMRLALEQGRYEEEGERVRKGGSRFWAAICLTALRDERGVHVGFAKITRDVSESRREREALLRSEEALSQSERRYAALVNSVGGIVWEADAATFRFTFVSPQAEKFLGYPTSQWLAEPDFWRAHTHPEDVNWCVTLCQDATAQGRDHEFEYRMVAADGRVVWLHDAVTVKGGPNESPRLRGIMLDVTERKKLEERLRQTQKMEAVGRLAAGVAHDFNNLLTVINGYGQILLERLQEGDPTRELVLEIAAAGERAAGLTTQLLAFSRQQVMEPRPVHLADIALDAEKLLRRLIGEDIALAVVTTDTGPVLADPGHLVQVVMNLAVNARDAMPRGGKLTVETGVTELGESYAKAHPGVAPGWYAVLAVSDTGLGMTEEVKARLFEPFFTTKGVGKGTGLGLAVVHGIVKQSGGHIYVYSEVGKGTTFKIYLPLAQGGQIQPGQRSGQGLVRTIEGGETVLVAEDDDSVRALTRHILEAAGYRVLEARDGAEALRECAHHVGPIHLVVSDVVMPHLGGRELSERLVMARPGVKVLFLSGYTDDAVVRHGVLESQVAFLQKPFTPGTLTRKVREVLDG